MSLDKGNVVVDLKDKRGLKDNEKKKLQESGVTEEQLNDFNFEEFDEAIEKSFQDFLKKTDITTDNEDSLQIRFNNWLDQECEKLNIMKNEELDEKIIRPVSFELVESATKTELQNLKEELLEADKKKTEVSVSLNVGKDELRGLEKTYNGIKAEDIAVLFSQNFEGRKHLLDLLKNKESRNDNIRKFQRIVAGIDENDESNDYSPETKKKLGAGVDGKFGKGTLAAFKRYAQQHAIVPGYSAVFVPKRHYTNVFANNVEKLADGFSDEIKELLGKKTLTAEETRLIIGEATDKNIETISFENLNTIDEDVAKVLAGYQGGKINLKSLTTLSGEVLKIFADSNTCKCNMITFNNGKIQKIENKYIISIDKKGGCTYEINQINNDLCKKLLGNNYVEQVIVNDIEEDVVENQEIISKADAEKPEVIDETNDLDIKEKSRPKSKEKNEQKIEFSGKIEELLNKDTLTAEEAEQIIYEATEKNIETIPFENLETIDEDVANVLAGYEGGKINLKSLTTLSTEVLKIFVDSKTCKCSRITFKNGKILKVRDKYTISISKDKMEYRYHDINDSLCNKLLGKKSGTVIKNSDGTVPEQSKVEETESSGQEKFVEGYKSKDDNKNVYKNLKDDMYGEESEEIVASNYDAIIGYMNGENNKNLIQAFQKLKTCPNNIANALAQVLEEHGDVSEGGFTVDHISKAAIKQLGRDRLFVNEKNQLVKILNGVDRAMLEKFIKKMKIFNDVRELRKTEKFVKNNENNLKTNPFLVLSDFSRNGTLGRAGNEKDSGLKHNGSISEQAMYDVFLSGATTESNGENKEIFDGEETADLVKGFVFMIKMAGEGFYDDIESDFSGGYTMENLGKYIIKNPETLELYWQTLNIMSYNFTIDMSNLVSYNGRQNIFEGKIQDVKELSTNRDEVQKRFEDQLGQDEEFNEWFKSLSEAEQKNFVGNMAVWLDKGGILPSIVKIFGVSSNTGVTVDNLDAVKLKWNFLKDDAKIGPRISLCLPIHTVDLSDTEGNDLGSLKGTGVGLHIDVPIANLTANFDLNRHRVENSVIQGVDPVYQLYSRLGANVGGGFYVGGEPLTLDNMDNISNNEDLRALFKRRGFYLSGAVEAALGLKIDYKKGIELKANHFGDVLQNKIFKDPDFSDKNGFVRNAKTSIDDILKSTGITKSEKGLRKFMENNKQEMLNCVDNVGKILDVLGVFDENKKPEYKQIILNSIMKGIVEGVKNQNFEELNGNTKLTITRLGIFGQLGAGFDLKNLFKGNFKDAFGAGWSAGLESTISAWNMIYLPDKEKYEYMDASLKNGEAIKPLGEEFKVNDIESLKNAIAESLSENSIPNIKVRSNDKSQIEISVTDDVLKKYEKDNIYELFNIYVNPEYKNNVAIRDDGKTLVIGGNDLKEFSVATRRYFNDFAVYIMIGGKGIDGCKNNKINEDVIGEYNTQEHSDNVSGFEFKETESTEKYNDTYYSIFSENELTKSFRDLEETLSSIDNRYDYINFMEATCDITADGFVDIENYNKAFNVIKQMLSANNNSSLSEIKNKILNINDENVDDKIFVVDRFKMIFALIRGQDTVEGLNRLARRRKDKYENLEGYDKSDKSNESDESKKFPLKGYDYRGKLIESLGTGKTNREHEDNLIGMTAFYKIGYLEGDRQKKSKRQLKKARGYSMTEIGGTDYIGKLLPIKKEHLEIAKNWFINNLDKTEVHKNILKDKFKEQIGCDNIDDNQLFGLLRGDQVEFNIDKGVKKVKIDVEYVFYLLRECANESIGVKLGNMNIVTETTKPNVYNPNEDHPDVGPDDNEFKIGVDGQVLTKTVAIEQDDINGKFSLGTSNLREPYQGTTGDVIIAPEQGTMGEGS